MKNLKLLKADTKGTMFVDLVIKITLLVIAVLMLISFTDVFIHHQNVNYMAKRLVREVEVSGQVTPNFYKMVDDLNIQLGLNAVVDISEAHYFDYFNKKIQLRDTFRIIVKDTYNFEVLSPSFGEPLIMPINLAADISGMSEVFWK